MVQEGEKIPGGHLPPALLLPAPINFTYGTALRFEPALILKDNYCPYIQYLVLFSFYHISKKQIERSSFL